MTGQTIHGVCVEVLIPPMPRRTCVVAMGFGAWLDSFELQRFERLARRLDARLVVVESPGLGRPGTSLSRRERAALLTGRYGPVAERMLAAATSQIPPIERIHLLGYSMGASIAAAMAGHSAIPVASLTFVEPVAIRPWTPTGLLAAVRREHQLIDRYLDETAPIDGSIAPSDRTPEAPQPARHGLDQVLLSAALCWGRLRDDLGRVAQCTPAPSVLLVHGLTSDLSRADDVACVVQWAGRRGLKISDVTIEGSHGLWQSLPRVDDLAQSIDDFWSATGGD